MVVMGSVSEKGYSTGHTFSQRPQSTHVVKSTLGWTKPSSFEIIFRHCLGHAFKQAAHPQQTESA